MTKDPEVYYTCGDCVLSLVKEASNGVYIEATTDRARCSTGCCAKATFVCRVYPDERESGLKEEPESERGDDKKIFPVVCTCAVCTHEFYDDETLFKFVGALESQGLPLSMAERVTNGILNTGFLIRERVKDNAPSEDKPCAK